VTFIGTSLEKLREKLVAVNTFTAVERCQSPINLILKCTDLSCAFVVLAFEQLQSFLHHFALGGVPAALNLFLNVASNSGVKVTFIVYSLSVPIIAKHPRLKSSERFHRCRVSRPRADFAMPC
jgi:hypothetical protein